MHPLSVMRLLRRAACCRGCRVAHRAACPLSCRYKAVLQEDVAKEVPELSSLGREEAALVRAGFVGRGPWVGSG